MERGVKMMKKSHRITALCIMLAMLVAAIPAIMTEAAESRMTYIISYSADLYISDSGEASITGYVRGKSDVTSTYVSATLQKKSGNAWIDVEFWEDSSTEKNLSIVETYSVSRGTYRLVVTVSANTETKTAISGERTY
jgi:hypothetical protein